jgi:adenylate cyclase
MDAAAGSREAPGRVLVRFLPSGRELLLPSGINLLEAARVAGLPMGSSCEGRAVCGWCKVTILAGRDELNPIGDEERTLLRRIAAADGDRIACQARALGEVTVTTSYW